MGGWERVCSVVWWCGELGGTWEGVRGGEEGGQGRVNDDRHIKPPYADPHPACAPDASLSLHRLLKAALAPFTHTHTHTPTATQGGAGGAAEAAHRQRVQDVLVPDGALGWAWV